MLYVVEDTVSQFNICTMLQFKICVVRLNVEVASFRPGNLLPDTSFVGFGLRGSLIIIFIPQTRLCSPVWRKVPFGNYLQILLFGGLGTALCDCLCEWHIFS